MDEHNFYIWTMFDCRIRRKVGKERAFLIFFPFKLFYFLCQSSKSAALNSLLSKINARQCFIFSNKFLQVCLNRWMIIRKASHYSAGHGSFSVWSHILVWEIILYAWLMRNLTRTVVWMLLHTTLYWDRIVNEPWLALETNPF